MILVVSYLRRRRKAKLKKNISLFRRISKAFELISLSFKQLKDSFVRTSQSFEQTIDLFGRINKSFKQMSLSFENIKDSLGRFNKWFEEKKIFVLTN